MHTAVFHWYHYFKETGFVLNIKFTARHVALEHVEHVRQPCTWSTKMAITNCSLQLGIPKTIIQNVLQKGSSSILKKIQVKHETKSTD
jgi:hypothetical protein